MVAWTPEFVDAAGTRAGAGARAREARHRHGPARHEGPATRRARCADAVAATRGLELVGLMTHFATADELGDDHFPEQLARFRAFADEAARAHPDVVVHAANSAATLREPGARTSTWCAAASRSTASTRSARPGRRTSSSRRWRCDSYVAAVKRFEPGESAGYGRTLARDASRPGSATLPIGYGDGWRRGLTNNADVLVGGRRHPLVGTVSMDNITVDLGPETDVEVGDPAVLIGAQGDERILAEEVARRLGTINYEVTCGAAAAGAARPRARDREALDGHPRVRAAREALAGDAGVDRRRHRARRAARPAARGPRPGRGRRPRAGRRARSRARGGGPGVPAVGAIRRLARACAATTAGTSTSRRSRATTIEEDLAQRDFAVNAIARAARRRRADRPARRARADLERAHACACSAATRGAYDAPTRCARCGWCASPPSWASRPTRDTERLTLEAAPRVTRRVAGARLRRAAPAGGRRRACSTGSSWPTGSALIAAVLPELDGAARRRAEPLPPPRRATATRSRCCASSSAIERDPDAVFGRELTPRVRRGCWPSRWPTSSPAAQALRFAALLHDIAQARHARELRRRARHVHRPRRAWARR